jgi:hypothetical protein
VERELAYLAVSVLDFLEREGETFTLSGKCKTVYVGHNMPSNLVSLMKNGSFLVDQEIEAKLTPYLVGAEKARISWQICSYLSTSFLLLHQFDERITYIDLIHPEIVQGLVHFAKAEGKYFDLSIAQ